MSTTPMHLQSPNNGHSLHSHHSLAAIKYETSNTNNNTINGNILPSADCLSGSSRSLSDSSNGESPEGSDELLFQLGQQNSTGFPGRHHHHHHHHFHPSSYYNNGGYHHQQSYHHNTAANCSSSAVTAAAPSTHYHSMLPSLLYSQFYHQHHYNSSGMNGGNHQNNNGSISGARQALNHQPDEDSTEDRSCGADAAVTDHQRNHHNSESGGAVWRPY